MSDTFKFELVSPEKLVMSEDVRSVKVPGSEGDFQMFVNHAPVMSTLRHGVLRIEDNGGQPKRVFVRGGLAEGGPSSLTVLAEHAIDLDSVDRGELEQHIKDLEEDVADAKDEKTRGDAEAALVEMREIATSL